jgi:hypothetical protein
MKQVRHSESCAETAAHNDIGMEAPDRRTHERYLTVCRIARVHTSQDAGLWRVRNISDEGMMFAAEVAMAVGDEIEIALSDTIALKATIRWIDNGLCGVAFAKQIDAAATLAALADERRGEGHRALRLPIEAEAIVMFRGISYTIDLLDISHRGAGFRSEIAFEAGAALDLLLPGAEMSRRALVRWSEGTRGGLWFAEPLGSSDLESMTRFGSPTVQ